MAIPKSKSPVRKPKKGVATRPVQKLKKGVETPVQKRVGAPPGNENASVHGFYSSRYTEDEMALVAEFVGNPTLDDEIFMQRIANLRLLDAMNQVSDHELLSRMFEALSTGLGRVAKLLRDKRALSGGAADGLAGAIAAALDEISTEMGVAL